MICKRLWDELLLLFWKKLLAKFLNNLLPCLTKHLNQYPMKEASTNLHKGVENNIHPLVIMLMDNLLHDYYNIFQWMQLFGCSHLMLRVVGLLRNCKELICSLLVMCGVFNFVGITCCYQKYY
nr:uncharacterized protein LOC109177640 [Ipomoea batatas]